MVRQKERERERERAPSTDNGRGTTLTSTHNPFQVKHGAGTEPLYSAGNVCDLCINEGNQGTGSWRRVLNMRKTILGVEAHVDPYTGFK